MKNYYEKFRNLSPRNKKMVWLGMGVILVFVVVFSMNISNIRGASFGWIQTDWSGGADTNAVATHATNQSGWTKFYSKDANVDTTGGEVKMSTTSSSFVTTSDADFNAGTGVMTYVSGNAVMARKPNGGSCTSNAMCINDVCKSNVCTGPWISGPCAGITVYKQDYATTKQWKTTTTACTSPQCSTGLDASYPLNYSLVWDNAVDFTVYPARDACKTLGGRLPTRAELYCVYTNKTQYNIYGAFIGGAYWTATEYTGNTANAYAIFMGDGSMTGGGNSKTMTAYVRCVQGL